MQYCLKCENVSLSLMTKEALKFQLFLACMSTIVPKCKSPESLNNYRPISLCNSVYKIVSKILVKRIKPYLNKLVSPFQTAFVPGRKGLDNVLVA